MSTEKEERKSMVWGGKLTFTELIFLIGTVFTLGGSAMYNTITVAANTELAEDLSTTHKKDMEKVYVEIKELRRENTETRKAIHEDFKEQQRDIKQILKIMTK